jgi:NTE family protein
MRIQIPRARLPALWRPRGAPDRPACQPAEAAVSGRGWDALGGCRRPLRLNLALQGGGAHGAFTWGVLIRLLEDEFHIEGISGASAGALNAVVLASGWLRGGSAGAAQALDELWREIGRLAQVNPLRASGLSQLAADFAAQFLSPYQINPLGVNPLRPVLERLVDFARLRHTEPPRLFVAATDVTTGRARIFRNHELSIDAVLASACLPQMHSAIEIDGTPYWDGGFSANPPLLPLVEACAARDLLLVQINRCSPNGRPARRARSATASLKSPSAGRWRTNWSACGSAPGRRSRRCAGWAASAGVSRAIACTRSTAAPNSPGSTLGPRSIRHGRCCSTCARAAGRRRMRG